jgi:hypothetical protein
MLYRLVTQLGSSGTTISKLKFMQALEEYNSSCNFAPASDSDVDAPLTANTTSLGDSLQEESMAPGYVE